MHTVSQPEALRQQISASAESLHRYVQAAAQQGKAAHEVEKDLWHTLLRMGRDCLELLFALCGDGDQGPTLSSPQGETWHRLDTPHTRPYVSIFGRFSLTRVAYGSREGQRLAFLPLGARLQLPEGAYSYLWQDWTQGLCVESAFGPVAAAWERMFAQKVSVDGLERVNQQMAEQVPDWRADRPRPAAESEGELAVASADGKGIVLRRPADAPPPPAHRTKGEKASLKRMAVVGSVYTVDRHVRTAEQVVAALFRDPRDAEQAEQAERRPEPKHKRVMASLSRLDAAGNERVALDEVHEWMFDELVERNRVGGQWQRPMVVLYDGQESLWEARRRHLSAESVEILDFLHVTPRLWKAAHLFHREGSDEAEAFVRERCLRLLEGRAEGVIRGLGEMATKRGLNASKKKALAGVCAYLRKNLPRMRYGEYLAAGYPIASGVIEGACRHLVKDRLERAGMHWTVRGAQAMLEVRSVFVEGAWDDYQRYRIEREARRLYPHRSLVEGNHYIMAA